MINSKSSFPDKHFHLLGVGGMGMAPLALFLKQAGCRVTGEDDNFHPRVHQLLMENGVEISQKPELDLIDGVIYSNAIPAIHPVLVASENANVESMRRGEFLAMLSGFYRTIVVAGSHGKTTTCALLIHALSSAGFNCNYVLGGLFSKDLKLPASHDSQSIWLVIEVDESDGSIQHFEPTVSLLVNVDWDHADFYESKNICLDTFLTLINRTKSHVFLNQSCKNSSELDLTNLSAAIHTFGVGGEARIEKFEDRVLSIGGSLPTCSLPVPFDEPFNAQNALAALSVVHLLVGDIKSDLLTDFPGLWRRQEFLYSKGELSVVEDYGHHPTEIQRLFEALRQKDEILTVVFQPHRYTRTLQFKRDFATVLGHANCLIVMEVYGAGERPIPGGTGADLFKLCTEVSPSIDSYFCESHEATMKRLNILNPRKGILLFLGAGDIQEVATAYVRGLNTNASNSSDDFMSRVSSLVSEETLLVETEPLANKTTLRVGGSAEFFAEPANETDLQVLLREAEKQSLAVHFLGRGSNLIVPDSGVKGLVIRLSNAFFQKREIMEDGRIRAGAGVRLKELCGFIRRHEVTGFEFLEGIPGCVGGALRMNAGAMGGWISEVISEVVLMNYRGDVYTVPAEDLHFGYRHCRELHDAIGLAVIFKAGDASNIAKIQHTMDAYQSSRKESQPRLPSAGCTFKNPEGSAAGLLIDQSGLKGLKVGGAVVSDIHGNFVVNDGSAKASDVISLINQLRKKVYQKTGYKLEPEVILFGDSWKNYLDPFPKESPTSHSISQS